MKERPILFSGEMVWAILEGRKNQTRRVIKPQPTLGRPWKNWIVDPDVMDLPIAYCSYGIPGDRLWIRETFWHRKVIVEPYYPGYYAYGEWIDTGYWWEWVNPSMFEESSPGTPYTTFDLGVNLLDHIHYLTSDKEPNDNTYQTRWEKRPSIHMPRWASRILLEITNVRVERIQDISHEDARAEGVESLDEYQAAIEHAGAIGCGTDGLATQTFARLWDRINARRGKKRQLIKPFELWCWGRDEHDDPESICLDVCSPRDILWRECETDTWKRFGEKAPPSDGYYSVIWSPGDEPQRVYLRRSESTEGKDYIFNDYSWASNLWVWVIEFEKRAVQSTARS